MMVQTHNPCWRGDESHDGACQQAKGGVVSSHSIVCPLEFGASHWAQLSHWHHPESLCSSHSDCAVILLLLITVADTEGLLAGSGREASLTQDRSKRGCSGTLTVQ